MTTSLAFTSDFRQEFEAETAALLRRRFLWFTGLATAFGLLMVTIAAVNLFFAPAHRTPGARTEANVAGGGAALATEAPYTGLITFVHEVAGTLLFVILFWIAWKRPLRRASVLSLSVAAITLKGALDIATFAWLNRPDWGLYVVIPTHLIACLFLPWSTWQAARPMIPLVLLNAAVWVAFTPHSVLPLALSPLVAAPGMMVSLVKHNWRVESFKLRFLQSRYGQIRRELVDARRIHEALFPRPHSHGPIRFDYRYEPMRQIGGDYLYARFSASLDGRPPAFNLILLDVTGHGIAAALTVNRLYGEVERLFAEDPQARPGEVLRALNRYVHLTLANHSIYATALCLRFDQAMSQLEYASGGHPPAFLRAVDGTIDQLPSTAFVLGACADADFNAAPQTRPFGPGDTLIAYTDGAIEARNDRGRMLGVTGLQRIVAIVPPEFDGGWASTILSAVNSHRAGPPADDTLVVEVVRTLELEPSGAWGEKARARTGTPAVVARV